MKYLSLHRHMIFVSLSIFSILCFNVVTAPALADLTTGEFDDPVQYCAAYPDIKYPTEGEKYKGKIMPRWLFDAAAHALKVGDVSNYGSPYDMMSWRCRDGQVLACFDYGVGSIHCTPWDTSRVPNDLIRQTCRENPNLDGMGAGMSGMTIHRWACAKGRPYIKSTSTMALDRFGFAEEQWVNVTQFGPKPKTGAEISVSDTTNNDQITTDGIGLFRAGTPLIKVRHLLGKSVANTENAWECDIFEAKSGYLAVMVQRGKVTNVATNASRYQTPTGLGVGSSVSDLKKAYGNRLVENTDRYDEGMNYILWSNSGNGIKFGSENRRVINGIVAGDKSILLMEGCL
jgi:hypothetical protein